MKGTIVFHGKNMHFSLDHRTGHLWRGNVGDERLHLAPKEWEVLWYLAERPGQLVTGTESLDAIWGIEDLHVGETSVSQAISKIRRVIGDQPKRSTVIETIQGRGYRFIATVVQTNNHPAATIPEPPARTGPIAVFRVASLDIWPYEEVQSQCRSALDDPIHLVTNLKWGTKYRCVPGPSQGIEWGLLSHNIGVREDKNGNDLISDATTLPNDFWIQVTYLLFTSTKRKDDGIVAPFRDRLMSGNFPPLPLTPTVGTPEVEIGALSDPHYQWYDMGEPPAGPTTIIFASSVSNLEYINAHTIPEGTDYQLVLALVVDLRTYQQIPSYRDLLENFDRLNRWYHQLSAT
jgi:DNA-binding winged helix-turn-helix (wHTH) protein